MLEKGKISALQMGFVMCPTVLASGFLVLPTVTAQFAQNDLWLTSVLAALIGLITVYIVTRLHELYPKQTVIQYSVQIVGKIPAMIFAMFYIYVNLDAAGAITRHYAEFVIGNFLFKTPILLIMASILVLSCIAVRGGVEVLARSAIIFTPMFILPVFLLLLLIPDMDVENIFPVLSHGVNPILKGSIPMMAWSNEMFMMNYFLPYLTDPEKGRKWGILSLGTNILFLTYVNLIGLFLLGADLGNKTYPILTAFRYISLANFFENLESLLLAMWVVGNFIQISVFLYGGVTAFVQCFRLSDYRSFVFPLGILCMIMGGLWDRPNFAAYGLYLRTVVPFQIFIIHLVIPLFLLIVAFLRNRKTASRGDPAR